MMMRWINNIQARWGLPCAYRLGEGGGCAGHNEPTDAQQCSAGQGDILEKSISLLAAYSGRW